MIVRIFSFIHFWCVDSRIINIIFPNGKIDNYLPESPELFPNGNFFRIKNVNGVVLVDIFPKSRTFAWRKRLQESFVVIFFCLALNSIKLWQFARHLWKIAWNCFEKIGRYCRLVLDKSFLWSEHLRGLGFQVYLLLYFFLFWERLCWANKMQKQSFLL